MAVQKILDFIDDLVEKKKKPNQSTQEAPIKAEAPVDKLTEQEIMIKTQEDLYEKLVKLPEQHKKELLGTINNLGTVLKPDRTKPSAQSQGSAQTRG